MLRVAADSRHCFTVDCFVKHYESELATSVPRALRGARWTGWATSSVRSRLDRARRKMVPAPQIIHRDIESIRDRHQRIAEPRHVVQRMRHRSRSPPERRVHRPRSIESLAARSFADSISEADRGMRSRCVERFARAAQRGSASSSRLSSGIVLDALEIEVVRSRRQDADRSLHRAAWSCAEGSDSARRSPAADAR